MSHVQVYFSGGPADGAIRALPAEADAGPPAHWVLSQRNEFAETGIDLDHLYECDRIPGEDGTWTMGYVRSDAAGITE
jgi:hypothetical protein